MTTSDTLNLEEYKIMIRNYVLVNILQKINNSVSIEKRAPYAPQYGNILTYFSKISNEFFNSTNLPELNKILIERIKGKSDNDSRPAFEAYINLNKGGKETKKIIKSYRSDPILRIHGYRYFAQNEDKTGIPFLKEMFEYITNFKIDNPQYNNMLEFVVLSDEIFYLSKDKKY